MQGVVYELFVDEQVQKPKREIDFCASSNIKLSLELI